MKNFLLTLLFGTGLAFGVARIRNADIASNASIVYTKLAALNTNSVVVTDSSGYITSGAVDTTKLSYLDVSSSLVSLFAGKQPVDSDLTQIASLTPGAYGTTMASNGTNWVNSTVPVPACNAISASDIDWSFGNCHTKTIFANTTFTFSGESAGQTIIVKVRNTGSFTVTFPNTLGGKSVMWTGSVPPVATTGNKLSIFTIFFDGNRSEMTGVFNGNF